MAKFNFKFEYGQKVLTPICERAGVIQKIEAFTPSGQVRYIVAIDFPYRNDCYFKKIETWFEEKELRTIGDKE